MTIAQNITAVKLQINQFCDTNITDYNSNFVCKLYSGNKNYVRDYCNDLEFARVDSERFSFPLMHKYNCYLFGAFL